MPTDKHFENLVKRVKYFIPALIVAVISVHCFGTVPVHASINNTINFQSKIVNKTSGLNISVGSPACVKSGADTCDFQVRIWNDSSASNTTPGTGNLMFTQTFQDVEIGDTNGIFNLTLNSCGSSQVGFSEWGTSTGSCSVQTDSNNTGSAGVDFNRSDLWLEVSFASADTSGSLGTFSETFSRINLKSVPSAFVAQTLSGIGASGFVQFAPSSAQTTTSTNSLINLTTTANTSNTLEVLNENGAGTPDLLSLQVAGSTKFSVNNSGDLEISGSGGYTANAGLTIFKAVTPSAIGYGISSTITQSGNNSVYGENIAINAIHTGTMTSAYGSNLTIQNTLGGTITNAIGFASSIQNFAGGTIGSYYGFQAASPSNGGTISTAYGFYAADQAGATNSYGIYAAGAITDAIYANTGRSTAKGIVIQGAASQSANLLEVQNSSGTVLSQIDSAGDISAGTTTNTAFVTAAAATTGKASLRLISSAGTNPSSPNSGEVWWNGTNLNMYNGTSTIDLLAFNAAGGVNGFIQYAPSTQQTTSSTNSLINIATTGNTSNPLIVANENGAGTPDLLSLQVAGSTKFSIDNSGDVEISNSGSYVPNTALTISRTATAASTGYGTYINIFQSGANSVVGENITANSGQGTGVTVPLLVGSQSTISNTSTGTVTNAEGYISSFTNNSGVVGAYYGFLASSPTNGGTLNNAYGLYVSAQLAGTNSYGVYVQGAITDAIYANTAQSTAKGIVIQGAASQSANLLEVQNSSNTVVAAINSAGAFTSGSSSTTRIEASGNGTGSSGSGSIYFLDSSGTTRGRLDTVDINKFAGDGADGAITLSASTNINTTPIATGRVTFADGIAYRVNPPGKGDLTVTRYSTSDTLTNGLVAGDDVLLINLQGNTTGIGTATAVQDTTSAGSYEILTIASLSASQVTFTTPTTQKYGGVNQANQKVVIQRVPNYTNVTINSGGILTASAYDGLTTTPTGGAGYLTGIVAFRANGTVTVNTGGSISVNGLGYRGGAAGAAGANGGFNGESYDMTGNNAAGTGGSGASNGQTLAGGDSGNGPTASPADQYPRGGGGGGGSNGSASAATNGSGGAGGGGYGGGGGGGGSGGELAVANNGGTGGTGGGTEVPAGGGAGSQNVAGVGANGGNAGSAGASATGTGGAAGSGNISGSGGGGGGAVTVASGAGGGGGGLYGSPTLTSLFYGSGGGGGAGGLNVNTAGTAGSPGGGIILIGASTLTMSGTGAITSNGTNATNGTAPASGGGGGAGGSIRIDAGTATLGTTLITANGGAVGTQAARRGASGAGGVGRIYVQTTTSLSGTTTPSATTGTSPNYGVLHIGSVDTNNADLAEYYVTGDDSIEAGDVVSISSMKIVDGQEQEVQNMGVLRKTASAYDQKVLGIISTAPGLKLGSVDGSTGQQDSRALALSGRVPVKIDPDSAPIGIGDFLTSSEKPGMAKKATQSGYTIGKALEYWNKDLGKSTIMVFVNLGWNGTPDSSSVASSQSTFKGLRITDVTSSDPVVTNLVLGTAVENSVQTPVSDATSQTVPDSTSTQAQSSPSQSQATSIFSDDSQQLNQNFTSDDASLQIGDLVSFGTGNGTVQKSGGDGKRSEKGIVGIVGASPESLVVKIQSSSNNQIVSLGGKAILKVTDENGPIHKGDFLAASSTPGFAMKADASSMVIGRALEDFPISTSADSQLATNFLNVSKNSVDNIFNQMIQANQMTNDQKNVLMSQVDSYYSTFDQTKVGAYTSGRILISENVGFVSDGLVLPKDLNQPSTATPAQPTPVSYVQQTDANLQTLDNAFTATNDEISLDRLLTVRGNIQAQVYKSISGLDLAMQISSAQNSFKVIDPGGSVLFAVDTNGKLTLKSGDNSSIGSVTLPAGTTEIKVSNTSVSNNSQVLLTSTEFVLTRVKQIIPGDGFVIETNAALDTDTKINYLVVN